MARAVLAVGALLWLAAGLAGLVLAAIGVEALERLLPPLAIDADALRGALTAVAMGVLLLAAVHVAILLGLRTRRRWSETAAILLAGLLAVVCLALAVAAATSAGVNPTLAPALVAAAIAGLAAAAAYGAAGSRLVSERRARSAL